MPPSPCLTPPSPGFIRSGGTECFLLFLPLEPQELHPPGWAAVDTRPFRWKVMSKTWAATCFGELWCIVFAYAIPSELNAFLFCSAQHFLLWNHTLRQPARWFVIHFQALHYPGHSLSTHPSHPRYCWFTSISSRSLSFLRTGSFLLISVTLGKYSINVW